MVDPVSFSVAFAGHYVSPTLEASEKDTAKEEVTKTEEGRRRTYIYFEKNERATRITNQDATPHGRRATPLGHLLHRPAGQEAARRWQGVFTLCLRFLRFLRLLVGFSSGGPSPSALLSARRRQRR